VAYRDSHDTSLRMLSELVESVEVSQACAPLLQTGAVSRTGNLKEVLGGVQYRLFYSLKWDDGPVAFHMRGIPSPLIAIPVAYHTGRCAALPLATWRFNSQGFAARSQNSWILKPLVR